MNSEFELFKGKSFSDLMKDIYHNSKTKDRQINTLIHELQPLIKNLGDATVIVPLIKEYLDVSVKNDEHLVKLASVLQRIITRSTGGSDEDSYALSDSEKEELMQTLQETAHHLQVESDKISEIKTTTKEVIEH